MTATTLDITEAQLRQFRDEGWFLLDSVIPSAHLDLLRQSLDRAIDFAHARMDEIGSDTWVLSHRGKRYFVNDIQAIHPPITEFLYSDLMAHICRATLGPDVWHFNNQYVVKLGKVEMTFEWHQDSGYVEELKPAGHKPYLSCWCPLDDVDESNGTIYVLPFSRAAGRGVTDHRRAEGTNDLVGYFGDDPGEPIVARAGSIVVFSSVLLHRSGANSTGRPRSVFLAQYTAEPIMRDDDPSQPLFRADPFFRDGRRVAG